MDMMKFLQKCLSYVPLQYANRLLYSSRTVLHLEHFLMFEKKAILFQSIKNRDKQLIDNYRPVSLLPIYGKLMKKVMFNSVFNFIDTRKMFSVHQSGFRPGDTCVHQLISIVHDIYNAFDVNPSIEVRSVFLDISKAFDRVWHKSLLYKLKCMSIDGKF